MSTNVAEYLAKLCLLMYSVLVSCQYSLIPPSLAFNAINCFSV